MESESKSKNIKVSNMSKPYLIQKFIKPSRTPNDTPLKDISHLYNISKTCSLEEKIIIWFQNQE